MKKTVALLLAALLLLSLAACGKTGGSGAAESAEEAPAAETAQPVEEPPETPADAQADEAAELGALKAQLVGDWGGTYGLEDIELLTFRADGTGNYVSGISSKEIAFTYALSFLHKAYANGAPYRETLMTVNYATGETEEIVIDFRESDRLGMVFHSTESTGYSGVINFDEFIKK